jgi:hypothetical protein
MENLGDLEFSPEEFQSPCEMRLKGGLAELPKGCRILLGMQTTGAVLSSGLLKSSNFKKGVVTYVDGVEIADVYFFEDSNDQSGNPSS